METVSSLFTILSIIVSAIAIVVIIVLLPKIRRSARNAEEAGKQMLEIADRFAKLVEEAEAFIVIGVVCLAITVIVSLHS